MDAGDIESMPFIQALGQFSYRVGEWGWYLFFFCSQRGVFGGYVKVVNHLFNFIYYSIVVIICIVINMFLFFSSHMKRPNDFDSKSFLIGMIL